MGVTQTNTINAIEPANNQIAVALTTDNFIVTPGETAWITILVNTKDSAENLNFQLSWDDNDLVFTSKTTPDNSGLQFPAGAAYASITLWLDAVVIYLNKNELLSSVFRIWHSGSNLYFESKEKSADYSLTFYPNTFNWSLSASNAGVDEVLQDNYSIVASVHCYIGGGLNFLEDPFDKYEKVKTYELEPLSDGTANIFIEEALKPYLRRCTIPYFSALGAYREGSLLLKYYYRYSDKFGTPAVQQSTLESSILYALPGGLNRKDFDNTDLITLLTGTGAKFLTWAPTTKYITKQQKDFLYFIQTFAAVTTLVFRVVGTKEDNTTATVDVGTFMGNAQYLVHMIQVDYDYIKSLFGVDLKSYTVQMVNTTSGSVLKSEKRTYKIIANTPLPAKYFLFKNSFGVYESYYFNGETTKGVQLDKLTTEKVLQYSDGKEVNEVVYGPISFNVKRDIYTGFKTQTQLNSFIDFLKGSDYLEQTATYFKPVHVDVKNTTLYSENDNVSSVKITILDNTEKNYSNA